jgi:quinol monooxygenase YgiN
MIIATAVISVEHGKRADLIDWMRPYMLQFQKHDGCLMYELLLNPYDEKRLHSHVIFESEDAFEKHRQDPLHLAYVTELGSRGTKVESAHFFDAVARQERVMGSH